jgi:hypothetical protein
MVRTVAGKGYIQYKGMRVNSRDPKVRRVDRKSKVRGVLHFVAKIHETTGTARLGELAHSLMVRQSHLKRWTGGFNSPCTLKTQRPFRFVVKRLNARLAIESGAR